MKLLIAGSRHFNDFDKLERALLAMPTPLSEIEEVVSGGCRGADALGEKWAELEGKRVRIFDAEWDKYGKSAGPIRNKEMAKYCDEALIFWDGYSKGTLNMMQELSRQGKGFRVVGYTKGKD